MLLPKSKHRHSHIWTIQGDECRLCTQRLSFFGKDVNTPECPGAIERCPACAAGEMAWAIRDMWVGEAVILNTRRVTIGDAIERDLMAAGIERPKKSARGIKR